MQNIISYNGNAVDGLLRVHMQDKNLGIEIYKAKIRHEEYKMLQKKKKERKKRSL